MDISIIIVSYNTAYLIADCLASVEASHGMEKEIFVVDNASSDKSVELITTRFPAVKIIANQENKGFGPANNQGLLVCNGRYVIFLNPDTTIAQDTLQRAVSYMDENQRIGLAGAKILNPDGSLQPSVSYKYPGEKFATGELTGLPGEIACVLGAFMIARKSLLIDLHGFDEDFFLYGEDQDLCWRIRKKGFYIGCVENAEVLHWGGQSEIKTTPFALFEKKLKAEYLFYKKHYTLKTIARIKKSQRSKAIYRLATLKWSAPFTRNKAKLQNKIECYKIALKMAQV
ncbi:MAG: glycosyltransferase family 2 protein [Candidatus Parcubacteria bacterium]|nr:glycosyltransferase family 2 protein [Candidatus Parcubacteria bacterium]